MATTRLRAIRCVHCGGTFSYIHEEPESPFYMNVGWLALCDCGGRTRVHGTAKKTNFEFSSVSGLDRGVYSNADIQSARLWPVYRTFIKNMDQVIAFGRLPHLFKLHYESFLRAFQVTDERVIADSTLVAHSPIGLPIDPGLIDPDLAWVMCRGVRIGLEGVLASMITGTWTAFETLAGDLWEAALNAAPKRLALLRGKQSRIERQAGSRAKTKQDPVAQANAEQSPEETDGDGPDRAVSLHSMSRASRGKFNLRHLMGTVQRDQFELDSLRGIREAYSRAFDKPTEKDIDQSLADRDLDTLQQVRNLLVHRAGVADQRYVDRLDKFPALPRLAKGKRLKLTGPFVADRILPVIRIAPKLALAVDRRVCREVTADG
jgi:hypothetical protein